MSESDAKQKAINGILPCCDQLRHRLCDGGKTCECNPNHFSGHVYCTRDYYTKDGRLFDGRGSFHTKCPFCGMGLRFE